MNTKSVVILLLLFSLLFLLTEARNHNGGDGDSGEKEIQDKFVEWMRKWNKSYQHYEFFHRYQTFKENVQYMQQFNNDNEHMKLGLNRFADMTNNEYRSIYLGSRLNGIHRLQQAAQVYTEVEDLDKLPKKIDWRDKGAVTHVKNQEQCGSCYSFSATGSMEAAHFFKTGKLVNLSEQNIVDCSFDEGNLGCQGGFMDQAFDYVIKNGGIDSEESYPYEATVGRCRYDKSESVATISNYTDIPSGNEKALQKAVTFTPVSVGIDASRPSFQMYESGVYFDEDCSSENLDHGVLVVGYGEYKGKPYWLVKNSWGDDWGMSGYIMMARNKHNHCGIATAASYPQA